MAKKKWTIVVILDGQTLKATSDGTEEGTIFEGTEDHIRQVKKAIKFDIKVDIADTRRSPSINSGYENPLSLTAALFSIMPMYTTLWKAPEEVWEFFRWNMDENHHSIVEITEA